MSRHLRHNESRALMGQVIKASHDALTFQIKMIETYAVGNYDSCCRKAESIWKSSEKVKRKGRLGTGAATCRGLCGSYRSCAAVQAGE